MSLDDLAARLRQGDPHALTEVWHLFGEELRRRARTRLRQYGISHEAESMDICNAVLYDLCRQSDFSLEKPQQVLHYVLRAIDNQVHDAFRELSRQRRDFRRNDQRPLEDHSMATNHATPSVALIRREIFSRIESHLASGDRPMVQWVLDNYSWEEIGQQLAIPADTARMRFQRAVRRVREEMLIRHD